MSLLLVDDRFNDQQLINCRRDDVNYITFSYFNDTFQSILEKIPENKYTNIGLVQHSNFLSGFSIVSSETIGHNSDLPPYNSFDNLKNFFIALKNKGVTTFDFLGCELYDPVKTPPIFNYLEQSTSIELRASSNLTGSPPFGDWIMESDNVNVKNLYFADEIDNWKGYLNYQTNSSSYNGGKLIMDVSGNVIYLQKDISGYALNPSFDSSGMPIKYPPSRLTIITGTTILSDGSNNTGADLTNIVQVESNWYAYAALKSDGTVVAWGDPLFGGTAPIGLNNVKALYANNKAFAALLNDGSVVMWGNDAHGGTNTYSANLTDIVNIFPGTNSFVALKGNGSLIMWGDISNNTEANLSSNIVSVATTDFGPSYAALKKDGTVVTFGNQSYGGNSTGKNLTGVVAVYPAAFAFAAIKNDGTVVTWGEPSLGGNSTDKDLSGSVAIYANRYAFAALKRDGSVVTWGSASLGGDSSSVSAQLTNVVSICASEGAFLALKKDGTTVKWGNSAWNWTANRGNMVSIYCGSRFGGLTSNGGLVSETNLITSAPYNSGILSIQSTELGFFILKINGQIATYADFRIGENGVASGAIKVYRGASSGAALIPNIPVNVTDYYYSTGGSKLINISQGSGGATYITATQAITALSTDANAVTNYITSATDTVNTIFDNVKSAVKTLTTDVDINNSKIQMITSLITKNGSAVINLTDSTNLLTAVNTKLTGLSSKPVKVLLPTISGDTGTLNMSGITTNSTFYTHIEMPKNTTINLTNVTPAVSLTYTGTAVTYVNNGVTSTKNLGDTLTIGANTYKLVALGSLTLEQTTGGAGGDPHITTINGEHYDLPNVKGKFLLFDNKKANKLRVTCDCDFLNEYEIAVSGRFKKNIMDSTFIKLVNIEANGQKLEIDMNTLKTNKIFSSLFEIGEIYEDKELFAKNYNKLKRYIYDIKFDGKSRNIKVKLDEDEYLIKLSVDLNCADYRTEVSVDGPDLNNGYGALVSSNHNFLLV